jgi:prevent-host-death family protein
MAGPIRKSRVKEIPLSEVKDDLSHFLREAEKRDIVITRHGKPAGVLIGFKSEDDWFDYRLENDPRFLRRIEKARESLRAGRGVRLEDVKP